MFFRIKLSGERRYLQIVENTRDGVSTRQRVLATLGRVEDLEADGRLDALAPGCAGGVFKAVGVALPPLVQQLPNATPPPGAASLRPPHHRRPPRRGATRR
jgi:hypothetical protein